MILALTTSSPTRVRQENAHCEVCTDQVLDLFVEAPPRCRVQAPNSSTDINQRLPLLSQRHQHLCPLLQQCNKHRDAALFGRSDQVQPKPHLSHCILLPPLCPQHPPSHPMRTCTGSRIHRRVPNHTLQPPSYPLDPLAHLDRHLTTTNSTSRIQHRPHLCSGNTEVGREG